MFKFRAGWRLKNATEKARLLKVCKNPAKLPPNPLSTRHTLEQVQTDRTAFARIYVVGSGKWCKFVEASKNCFESFQLPGMQGRADMVKQLHKNKHTVTRLSLVPFKHFFAP